MENVNEIKKALYKEKPIATYLDTRGPSTDLLYEARIESLNKTVQFKIPEEEGKDFSLHMSSQLLIRWLVIE